MTDKIGHELAEKTYRELGFELVNGKLREIKGKYGNTNSSRKLPFRIPIIDKTTRQFQNTQGYKASAAWQTSMLLYDLIHLWTPIIPYHLKRKREQIESAIWSVVSTFEEGWARPSTKEYLDFIGFSQASLAEVRGCIERFTDAGVLKTGNYAIPTPSRNFPYPPVNSRIRPTGINGKLREFTGKNLQPRDLTYELFIELINKVDYLLARTVEGLQNKVVKEEKNKLKEELEKIHRDW